MNLQLHYKLPVQPLLTTATATTTTNSSSTMIDEIYSHELESYFPARTEEKTGEQLKKSCSFSNFQSLLSQEETNKNKFLVDLTQKKLKIFAFLSESSSSAFRNKILLQNTLKRHHKDDDGSTTEPIKITDEDYTSFMSTDSYNVPTMNVKFTPRKRELRELNDTNYSDGDEWRTDFKKLKVSCPSEESEMKVNSNDRDDDFLPDDLASVLLALRTLE